MSCEIIRMHQHLLSRLVEMSVTEIEKEWIGREGKRKASLGICIDVNVFAEPYGNKYLYSLYILILIRKKTLQYLHLKR